MCIVIDANTLSSVFDNSSANHNDFKPVYDWIYSKKGKIVFGGTKYQKELGTSKYLATFTELSRLRKTVYVNNKEVDNEEKNVSKKIQHKDFDDQHLVGLLLVSGCKLICSLDKRAYKYFTHSDFFKPSGKKPKIYSKNTNKNLLINSNIADICQPCVVLSKAQKELIKGVNTKK